jgi:hypothetical protein
MRRDYRRYGASDHRPGGNETFSLADSANVSTTPAPVLEPSTLFLLGTGVLEV